MGKTGSYEESSYKVIKLKCQGGNENETCNLYKH